MPVLINPYRHAIATPTLDTAAAWWTPASISGGALTDRIGSVHLTFGGGPTATNDGTYRIVQFRRASSQYAEAASGTSLDVTTGSFTLIIVAKLQPALSPDNSTFIGKRSGTGAGYVMRFDTNGDELEGVVNGGSSTVADNAPRPLNTTSIYGLTLRRDGSAVRVLVDGVVGTGTGTSSQNLTTSSRFNIARLADATLYIDMDFYGAGFWSSALSDAQTTTVKNELLAVAAL